MRKVSEMRSAELLETWRTAKARLIQGASQAQVARELNVSPVTMNRWVSLPPDGGTAPQR